MKKITILFALFFSILISCTAVSAENNYTNLSSNVEIQPRTGGFWYAYKYDVSYSRKRIWEEVKGIPSGGVYLNKGDSVNVFYGDDNLNGSFGFSMNNKWGSISINLASLKRGGGNFSSVSKTADSPGYYTVFDNSLYEIKQTIVYKRPYSRGAWKYDRTYYFSDRKDHTFELVKK